MALRIILGTDYISYANALDVCDVDRLSAQREQHSLQFAQSLHQCSQTSKLLPPCRGEIHGRQLRNNAKLTCPVLAPIDMLVVQSHIMWSWSTTNSHNWILAFYFLLCSSASQLGLVSLLSIVVLLLCFWSYCVFTFFSYIVLCNSAFGPSSYHIIISYHKRWFQFT